MLRDPPYRVPPSADMGIKGWMRDLPIHYPSNRLVFILETPALLHRSIAFYIQCSTPHHSTGAPTPKTSKMMSYWHCVVKARAAVRGFVDLL